MDFLKEKILCQKNKFKRTANTRIQRANESVIHVLWDCSVA